MAGIVPLLELVSISHAFGAQVIFEDFNLRLKAGDRCVVRGKNGSGKSTLLKLIAGLLRPNSGEIRRPDTGIGYLSPDLVLYHELTLLENLDFFARVRGLPRGKANLALLDQVDLQERAHDPAGELSTGLGQRLKLVYALQGSPGVLLLDEPNSNLDEAGRATVEQVIKDSGSDIVMWTSHEPLQKEWINREVVLG